MWTTWESWPPHSYKAFTGATSPNSDLFPLHFYPCFLEAHHQLMANAKLTCPTCSNVFLSTKIRSHQKDMHCLRMTFKGLILVRNKETDAFDCVKLGCFSSTKLWQDTYNHLRMHQNLSEPKQRQLLLTQFVPASKPVSRPPKHTSRPGPSKAPDDDDISMGSDWGEEIEGPLLELHAPLPPMFLRHDSVMWDVSPELQPPSPCSTTLYTNVHIAYVSKILHRWFPALVGSVLIYSSVDHRSE